MKVTDKGVRFLNSSFFRGMLAGSILGAFVGVFSVPQRKPLMENAKEMMDNTKEVQNRARKVLMGISKGVSEMIK